MYNNTRRIIAMMFLTIYAMGAGLEASALALVMLPKFQEKSASKTAEVEHKRVNACRRDVGGGVATLAPCHRPQTEKSLCGHCAAQGFFHTDCTCGGTASAKLPKGATALTGAGCGAGQTSSDTRVFLPQPTTLPHLLPDRIDVPRRESDRSNRLARSNAPDDIALSPESPPPRSPAAI